MDITILFKAYVKTIKTRNRALCGWTNESEKARILPTRDRKCEFTTRSREIVQQIARLNEFLSRHRKGYLNISNHLDYSEMSEFERDDIESRAQKVIGVCTTFLALLDNKAPISLNIQHAQHKHLVFLSTKNYLKEAYKTYSELRTLRLRRSLELQEMAKIESKSARRGGGGNRERRTRTRNVLNSAYFWESEPLSQEELQMFEMENSRIYNELNSLTDEIQQIERKVIKIAELQNLFTEKVLQQDLDIDRIATIITGTTENVKDANDQIREAIQRNAGLRVWILFFLLVISFSLLFLDWYND